LLIENCSAQPGSWSEQNSGVTATLTSVWSVDASNVWVCGYLGTVLKSANGGTNWTNLTGNGIPTTVSLISICGFPSGNTNALVAGYTGTNTWVWKTTNGGTNWTQVFAQTGGFINAVWMTSATNGFMMGDPVGSRWSLWKTTNGGTNWDSTGMYLPQTGTETGYNNSMICAPPYIWFGTNNTKIYFSSNNGANWITQITTGEANSFSIWFHPLMQNGQGLFGGANLFQTTNNGINWTALTSMGSGSFGGITSTPLLTSDNLVQPVWYVRSSNLIYYSANFGANWSIDYTNPATTTSYRHISMAYPGRGIWVVGTLGKITYHMPLMGIGKIGSEIPVNYNLHQNYPNPFNPATKIKFDIQKSVVNSQYSEVTLKVFDILGKEIQTLVNEQLQPGTYEVTFEASQLTSGVYLYKLMTDGFSETKRMLLIK
jgi:photosystem II stability/assembly factor-like uncharacterized protein